MSFLSRQNIGKILLGVAVFALLFLVADAAMFFSQNLRLGDRGGEVLELQRALNQNPFTKVAEIGPGSPGSETSYFGPLTHNAVIRFQELYSAEVLTPINLFSGTGFVGSMTRAKLNQTQPKPVVIEVEDLAPQPISTPILLRTNPAVAQTGHFLSAYGSGFQQGDEVYVAGVKSPETEIKTSGLISFAVPHGISQGEQYLEVRRGNLISNKISLKIIATGTVVLDGPSIDSITPSFGTKGAKVIIKGGGFEFSNTIHAGYDIITNIGSSDGETIEFTINPPWPKYRPEVSSVLPLWIYVENTSGISNSAIFDYTL